MHTVNSPSELGSCSDRGATSSLLARLILEVKLHYWNWGGNNFAINRRTVTEMAKLLVRFFVKNTKKQMEAVQSMILQPYSHWENSEAQEQGTCLELAEGINHWTGFWNVRLFCSPHHSSISSLHQMPCMPYQAEFDYMFVAKLRN